MNMIHYAVMKNRKELLFSVTYAITRVQVHYDNSSPLDLKSIYPCLWHHPVPTAGNQGQGAMCRPASCATFSRILKQPSLCNKKIT